MARAVIYARYSSHSQRDESIEDQVRVCREAAAREGDEVVRVYADRATSGTSTAGRTEFARMVADSATASWDRVYVYKTDRFARNRYDSAIYKARLKRNGVRVVSATENIQDGPDGILLEAVLEGMAEYYSANLGENVRRGMHGNALRCGHNGVLAYGYDNGADGLFHVREDEAAVVRAIFEGYDSGLTIAEVAEDMSWARTRWGAPITPAFVSRVLHNDRYVGTYRFKGAPVVEDGVPAIVDRALWDRVQERLASRGRRRRGAVRYLLSGMLSDEAGNRYHGVSGHGRNGTKYTYYRCPETGHTVRRETVEADVASLVSEALRTDEFVAAVLDLMEEFCEEERADGAAAIESMGARLRECAREQDRLVELAAKTGPSDAIARRLRELSEEEAGLRASLEEAEREYPPFDRARTEFFLREVGIRDVADVIRAFVTRAVIDRGRNELRVEFAIGNPGQGRPSGVRVREAWQARPASSRTKTHRLASDLVLYVSPWVVGLSGPLDRRV